MKYFFLNNTGFQKNGFSYCQYKGKVWTNPAVKCEECGSFITSLEWLPPYTVKVSKGMLADIIYGTINPFIVSQKFKDIYEQNECVGINSFNSVILHRNNNILYEKYYYPKIELSNVKINISKSNIIFEGDEQCSLCQSAGRQIKQMDGIYFENNEINEDIFCTKILPGDIIVSEKLKKLLENLPNVSFIDIENYKPIWL